MGLILCHYVALCLGSKSNQLSVNIFSVPDVSNNNVFSLVHEIYYSIRPDSQGILPLKFAC